MMRWDALHRYVYVVVIFLIVRIRDQCIKCFYILCKIYVYAYARAGDYLLHHHQHHLLLLVLQLHSFILVDKCKSFMCTYKCICTTIAAGGDVFRKNYAFKVYKEPLLMIYCSAWTHVHIKAKPELNDFLFVLFLGRKFYLILLVCNLILK